MDFVHSMRREKGHSRNILEQMQELDIAILCRVVLEVYCKHILCEEEQGKLDLADDDFIEREILATHSSSLLPLLL